MEDRGAVRMSNLERLHRLIDLVHHPLKGVLLGLVGHAVQLVMRAGQVPLRVADLLLEVGLEPFQNLYWGVLHLISFSAC